MPTLWSITIHIQELSLQRFLFHFQIAPQSKSTFTTSHPIVWNSLADYSSRIYLSTCFLNQSPSQLSPTNAARAAVAVASMNPAAV
jgi:hypothetical protein